MNAKRFLLFAVLFAASIAAVVASVEVGRQIASVDETLASVAEDLATHVAAGGGTSVDGDGYGTSIEVIQMNNLAWRNELVVRLWSLRIVGPLMALAAMVGMGVALVGKGKRRPPRRRGRRTPTRGGKKRGKPRRRTRPARAP